jgi:hypothetical protein
MDLIQTDSDALKLLPSLIQAAGMPKPFLSEAI